MFAGGEGKLKILDAKDSHELCTSVFDEVDPNIINAPRKRFILKTAHTPEDPYGQPHQVD